MARPGKKRFEPVDYSQRTGERRRLTNYLRTGNFKKIGGSPIHGHGVLRNRLILTGIMTAIIAVGVFYATR